MSPISFYFSVAVGGAFGASMRYFLFEIAVLLLGRGFPYATLAVNVLGSFLMGMVYAAIQQEYSVLLPWRGLISIGFLGAFTTFSTFSLDTLLLIQQGDWLKAALNVGLNVFVCIFMAWAGMRLI